ncbi:L domain-like protein [Suhomyces tanzawaensis NRRL Y-17324]|uniref:L domain-like protein n=1 Tax=Suhomyces tanzawaensis NRRL Y-17324 TaxID=984487 RepID=A0A1E4SLS3_9ASCO|nr:L domain-like protein [Suhomyces tanzawaensis NRRL Y-17324]ODV80445.1 L domain-like protein [Suhomyces tanzawaensis NRRL Y-17324]
MAIISQLPPELLGLTLSCLQSSDLDRLFNFVDLVFAPPSGKFRSIQQMALYHYYSHKNLVVTTNNSTFKRDGGLVVSYPELQYLAKHRIMIQPHDITFVLDNNFDEVPLELINFMMILNDASVMHFISQCSHNINIELKLHVNSSFQNNSMVRHMFASLDKNGLTRIAILKIHYYGCAGHSNQYLYQSNLYNASMNRFSADPRVVAIQKDPRLLLKYVQECDHGHNFTYSQFCPSCISIQISSLVLQNFDVNKLNSYFSANTLNFCQLKRLDLSYNGLVDLRSIKFPSSLTHLNLSNNNLINLNSSNFNLKDLKNLEELNLSNNNLINIDFRELQGCPTYKIKKLQLNCNSLVDLSFLRASPFVNVIDLDLSRNLISKLQKFPSKIVKLDLSGNYIADFFNQLDASVFPSSLNELNISGCKINCSNCDFTPELGHCMSSWISEVAQLFKIKSLCASADDLRQGDFIAVDNGIAV